MTALAVIRARLERDERVSAECARTYEKLRSSAGTMLDGATPVERSILFREVDRLAELRDEYEDDRSSLAGELAALVSGTA